MEKILPPTQGTTFRIQSPLFNSIGVIDSSIPFCPETFSTSGTCLAFSVKQFAN